MIVRLWCIGLGLLLTWFQNQCQLDPSINQKTFLKVLPKQPSFSFSSLTHIPVFGPFIPSTTLPHVLPRLSLQACVNNENLIRGQQIHSYMLTNGCLNSPFSITSLINMYSKCSWMNYAVSIFDHQSCECNLFAYNIIIAGFIANGLASNEFDFHKKMQVVSVMPDKFTFPCVVRACCDVVEVWKIHGMLFNSGWN